MGKDAVEAYKKALNEGECKIPYCSMLILGEQRVGKTSLYRQLVGLPYIKGLDATKGIDNNTVETVDTRSIEVVKKDKSVWAEVTANSSSSFTKAMTDKTIEAMPKAKEKSEASFKAREESDLLRLIEKLRKQLVPPSPPPPPPPSRNPPHEPIPPLRRAPYIRMAQHVFHPPQRSLPSSGNDFQDLPQRSITRNTTRVSADSSQKKSNIDSVKKLDVAPVPPAISPSVESPPPAVMATDVVETEGTPSVPSEPDSTPQTATPEGRVDEKRVMNRRQGIFMAKELRRRNKKEQSCFELTLNALDFAGQNEYRPMHHCFISRRACYLVVFKIPDLLGGDADTNSEEIRYWIHSINAHIYPPEEEESEKDETINRVLLIGTHMDSYSEEKLKKVDETLKKLRDDKRCANHLVKPKSMIKANHYNNFIPVENSIDFTAKGSLYLKESHTDLVQKCIKSLSERLPFLKEDYPIKWLRFKEHIESIESSCPVITMEKLVGLAEDSLITSDHPKGQEVAIRFLHDSGKIICLSKWGETSFVTLVNYF